MTQMSAPLRCKCRRQSETSLRCSRCNVPICPDCSHMYSVGMLCRDCARGGKSSRLYELSPVAFGKTLAVCLPVGVLMGWLITSLGGFGLMSAIWGGLFQGLAVSEAGLRASGRKLGWKIEALVGSCIVIGLMAGWLLIGLRGDAPPGEFLLSRLTDPWAWAMLVFATVVGVARFRNI